MIYADTNFLVKNYLPMPESPRVTAALQGLHELIPVTWLLEQEITNAIEQLVFLHRTTGHLRVTPEMAAAAHATFEDDLSQQLWLSPAVFPWPDLRAEFRALSLRHTAKHGFRTYDILHVTSARLLGCDEFWSFDGKARQLAELEGLQVNALA